MKIQLNGIIKDYSSQEVATLKRQGYRFRYDTGLDAFVPVAIKINEDGDSRITTIEELVQRRAKGEKFLKVKGKPIYSPTDTASYSAIMRPIWREDKREKRSLVCIYKGKPCCKDCDCDSCTHPVYMTKSLEQSIEVNDPEIPVIEDVAATVNRKQLVNEMYQAITELDPKDIKILLLKASEMSERVIAEKVGFSSKTSVVKRLNKIIPRLQSRLKNFL